MTPGTTIWSKTINVLMIMRYESDPEGENWDDSSDLDSHPSPNVDGYTPVPTGTDREYTASQGFCGGDDDGEHLVTQESSTSLLETDREVMGVAQTLITVF